LFITELPIPLNLGQINIKVFLFIQIMPPWPVTIDINDNDHRLIQIFSNNQTAFDLSINNPLPLLIDDANTNISYSPLLSLLSI